ncbi:hypothetical protein L1987_80456 [Smallanthus sonchifolius]|uniref:Uncharacterized protein n=1 Tax=Smallanthus sonchifolius TaxID=185202 RepID=A0ACB8YPA1_9ASTR|nr:hypothetical protein L1987_80456 [Smallanthus sonchifolius]
MESFGSFLDEEWESLSRIFSGDQDSDHFSSHSLFSNEQDNGFYFETPAIVSSVMTDPSNIVDASFINSHAFSYAYENGNPNFYHNFSQETSNNGCVANGGVPSFPYTSSNIIPLPTNGVCDHEPMDFYEEINNNSSLLADVFSNDSMEELLSLRQNINIQNLVDSPSVPMVDDLKHTPAKRKIEKPESPNIVEDEVNGKKLDENRKKKARVSRDNKTKKKVQPKKKLKVMDDKANVKGIDGEDTNNNKVEGNAPIASSSSCSSEDDTTAINSNWKTRAGRGAATDPQSLYARKRRERINERLKVLQNLVPNGTKVDISTMLEESVQYVKFLQLQIKLLSSDEMWMYAPIAYNGMDMGLYQKLSQS